MGAGETTPFRLTAAYSAFINGGKRITPHLIELVEDRDGRPILNADQRPCPRCDQPFSGDESPRVDPGGTQILDPIAAYQMVSLLEGVVQHGTAYQANVIGRPIGGKTGTTNDFRSAWFVGFSPDIVVGVFVGFDDNRSLGSNETGAVDAVPIFIDFMQSALKDTPGARLPGAVRRQVRDRQRQPRSLPARHRADAADAGGAGRTAILGDHAQQRGRRA